MFFFIALHFIALHIYALSIILPLIGVAPALSILFCLCAH